MADCQVFCACGEESILVARDDPAAQVRLALVYARWQHRHNGDDCREIGVAEFDAMGTDPSGDATYTVRCCYR